MINGNIKKLAKLTISSNNQINKKVGKFALENLSRKEVIEYSMQVKKIVYDNSVRIISAEPLSGHIKVLLEKKFKGDNIFYENDEALGDGIKAITRDTIIDLSLKEYLDTTLNILGKNN